MGRREEGVNYLDSERLRSGAIVDGWAAQSGESLQIKDGVGVSIGNGD